MHIYMYMDIYIYTYMSIRICLYIDMYGHLNYLKYFANRLRVLEGGFLAGRVAGCTGTAKVPGSPKHLK